MTCGKNGSVRPKCQMSGVRQPRVPQPHECSQHAQVGNASCQKKLFDALGDPGMLGLRTLCNKARQP